MGLTAATPYDDTDLFEALLALGVSLRSGTGLQVCVHDGESHARCATASFDSAEGLPDPFDSETAFRVYCALKPALAYALLRVATARNAWAETIDWGGEGYAITVHDLLTRGVRVAAPMMHQLLTSSTADRMAWRSMITPASADDEVSDYVTWAVQSLALEQLTGRPAHECVAQLVFNPLCMSRSSFRPAPEDQYDMGLYWATSEGGVRTPLLYDRTLLANRDNDCGLGGYSTAHDLRLLISGIFDDPGVSTEARLAWDAHDARPLGVRTVSIDRQVHATVGVFGASIALYDRVTRASCGVLIDGVLSGRESKVWQGEVVRAFGRYLGVHGNRPA